MRILLFLFAAICWGSGAIAECRMDRVTLIGAWGQADFKVDVVETPEDRAQGLMFRDHLGQFEGMLFVFPNEQERAFWMKNTLIPLDILHFDKDGVLVSVSRNAVPGDLTALPSFGPAQYTLEINGGLARRLGIGAETRLIHPSVNNSSTNQNCLN